MASLELKVGAIKGFVLHGEGVVLTLRCKATRALKVESPGLNDSKTRVRITPKGGAAYELSGVDHRRLHSPPGDRRLGIPQELAAGEVLNDRLHLLDYARPLEPGKYQVEVLYEVAAGDVAQGGPVHVTVLPAQYLASSGRWFAGRKPRGHLERAWTVKTEDGRACLFSSAQARDLDAPQRGLALELAGLGDAPRVATFRGNHGSALRRTLCWADAEHAWWVQLGAVRPVGKVSQTSHGLDAEPAAELVDPPLQRKKGGVSMALLGRRGGEPSVALVEVDAEGHVEPRWLPLSGAAGACVVAWGATEEPATGSLLWGQESGGRWTLRRRSLLGGEEEELFDFPFPLLDLVADDHGGGEGYLYALLKEPAPEGEDPLLRTLRFSLSEPEVKPEPQSGHRVGPQSVVEAAVSLPRGEGLALLVRQGKGRLLLAPGLRQGMPVPEGELAPPDLLAPWKGLFLVEKGDALPVARRVDEEPK